jgi:hypothetical protein
MCCPVVGWIRAAVLAERAAFIYILVLYSKDERYGLARNYSTGHQNTENRNENKSPENLISVCHHNHNHNVIKTPCEHFVSDGILYLPRQSRALFV